jgi:hypothetical protein
MVSIEEFKKFQEGNAIANDAKKRELIEAEIKLLETEKELKSKFGVVPVDSEKKYTYDSEEEYHKLLLEYTLVNLDSRIHANKVQLQQLDEFQMERGLE